MDLIGTKPDRGRSCDEIRPGYRKFSVGSHVVFYRVTDVGSDVVRILHRRMDFTSRL
jgi:toxin ParE1/3/4